MRIRKAFVAAAMGLALAGTAACGAQTCEDDDERVINGQCQEVDDDDYESDDDEDDDDEDEDDD